MNPCTGKKMTIKDLYPVHFYKNSDNEYHCPVTYKVFTLNSKIAVIRTSGNVYLYDCIKELNIDHTGTKQELNHNIEMQRAIERANKVDCILIPIIVRPCLWKVTPIKDILVLPKDGTPISQYADKDEAYLEIVSAVNDMINSYGQ